MLVITRRGRIEGGTAVEEEGAPVSANEPRLKNKNERGHVANETPRIIFRREQRFAAQSTSQLLRRWRKGKDASVSCLCIGEMLKIVFICSKDGGKRNMQVCLVSKSL